jgi:hypothetical protein
MYARTSGKEGLSAVSLFVQVGYTPGTGFNLSEMQQRWDPISACTPSVLCDAAYSCIKDAIIDIYAVNIKLKAMGLCTGDSPFDRQDPRLE